MRPLTSQELLQVWEQGLTASPARRALGMLAMASSELSLEQLAVLPVGQRDGQLLTLREWTFGSHIGSVAHCPKCSETLELNFAVSDIRAEATPTLGPELWLEQAGYRVRYRLPNSLDVEAVSTLADAAEAQAALLSCCLLKVDGPGEGDPSGSLPKVVAEAVVQAMAEQDPQANVELALTCPACQHQWLVGFDIVTFFWHELTVWAHRLLGDIHRLARSYGWSEAEILALSPLRRQSYLEMVGL